MSGLPVDALFEALANGLWRGSLLAVVAAVLMRLFKRTTAAERYAVWLAVLTVIALAPVTEALLSWARPAAPPMAIMLTSTSGVETAMPAPIEAPQQWEALALSGGPFLWLWSFVGLALVVQLCRRCTLAARLKRNALPPDIDLTAALEQWESRLAASRVGSTRVTRSLRSPAAVGWLEPAVLLPDDAQASADSKDLEMLWRHEQAHVARRDDWTQLISECLFALAWFHPAAHWVRRQLERERELACDETVVNSGVEAGLYAGALGRWAERATTNELAVGVMGLGRSPALIIRRIEMLLSPSRILRRSVGRWAFTGSLAAALGASFLLTVSGPLVIRAQSVDVPLDIEVEAPVSVAVEPVLANPVVRVAPVDLALDMDLEVPVSVVVPTVDVEPMLMSQAVPPAPPAPPAPRPSPVPAPAAVPAPPVPPAPAWCPRQDRGARRSSAKSRQRPWQNTRSVGAKRCSRKSRRFNVRRNAFKRRCRPRWARNKRRSRSGESDGQGACQVDTAAGQRDG